MKPLGCVIFECVGDVKKYNGFKELEERYGLETWLLSGLLADYRFCEFAKCYTYLRTMLSYTHSRWVTNIISHIAKYELILITFSCYWNFDALNYLSIASHIIRMFKGNLRIIKPKINNKDLLYFTFKHYLYT